MIKEWDVQVRQEEKSIVRRMKKWKADVQRQRENNKQREVNERKKNRNAERKSPQTFICRTEN